MKCKGGTLDHDRDVLESSLTSEGSAICNLDRERRLVLLEAEQIDYPLTDEIVSGAAVDEDCHFVASDGSSDSHGACCRPSSEGMDGDFRCVFFLLYFIFFIIRFQT